MNKKLLTLLFAILMVSMTSFGQQDNKSNRVEYTFSVNNAQSAQSCYVPIYGNRVNQLVRSQFVLPRESLTRMLYGEIKRMAFFTVNTELDWPGAEFDVYLAEVGFTDFEGGFYDWDAMSKVYSGPLSIVYCDTCTGIMSFNFDNNFIYEGGDLLIGIKQTNVSSKKSVSFLGVSHSGHNTSIYAFGSYPYNYYEEFLPMTRLTYIKHNAPSCIRPLEVTLSNCGADNAEINWISGEGQTAWQLVCSTDATFNPDSATLIEVPSHPFLLSGLNPETEYHVYIRANCGNDNYSDWSDRFSFTTTATCVTPSNLELVSQNGISAQIGWTGQSSNYALRYRNNAEVGGEILLSCDFENGTPSGWNFIDYDGDGHGWSHDNAGYLSFEGNGSMYSLSYFNMQSLFADDWLVTPSVDLGGTVTFYAKGRPHYSLASTEHFAVYISTTNTNVESFTQISPEYIATSDYALYSVDLSSYSGVTGYIAIRHFNSWNTASICIDNFTVYSEPATWTEIEGINTNTYTLNGLTEQSYYEVQAKAVCSTEDVSEWSESMLFNTWANCANYVVDAMHPFYEGFESSTFPPVYWSAPVNYSMNWLQFVSGASIGDQIHDGYHTGFCSACTDIIGHLELVMPEMQIVGNQATLTFWSYNHIDNGGGKNYVYISTNGGSDFTKIWESSPTSNHTWSRNTITLGSSYLNKDVIIKFYFVSNPTYDPENGYLTHYSHKWFLDDVAITVSYDKEFVTAGNWNVASNWSPAGVPTSSQSVLISKAATIPSGCVAEAKAVKIGNGSLAIADGGQLKHNNSKVNATVKKVITGYGTGTNNWNLIATPVERSHYPTNVTNLIPMGTNYDLYRFDQNSGIEWRNYKQGEIKYINNAEGYLYANSTTTNIQFVGELMPSQEDVTVALECQLDHPEYDSRGWNLIGNPFACNAYLQGNLEFYKMNADGSDVMITSGAIAPCEGVFVKATSSGQSVTFTRTSRSGSGNQMDLNLSDAEGQTIDRARIHLNSTQRTDKFSLYANSTKLYISDEGNDYAAFGTESSGEIPVNFKSSEDGKYCISVNCDVNMGYLHLIDNLTGTDIDLRKTPTYSFDSKTTDYASRFKVVFFSESDGNEDSFAFVNNGKLIVLDANVEATLQVIDMTGRILCSERISGSNSMPLNYTPGIYVLRLIEGNEVRTQKIVLGRN